MRGRRTGGIPARLEVSQLPRQGTSVRPWLYRVVVNTCNSKLRQDIPRRERSDPDHDLDITPIDVEAADRFAATNDVTRA